MHENLAVIFWQLYYGKISFAVLVPGLPAVPDKTHLFC